MQCEVCGQAIFGAPVRAIIEGANMNVCEKCAKLSSGSWEPQPKLRPRLRPSNIVSQPVQSFAKRKPSVTIPEAFELVADAGELIRKTRIEMGLSHEDLGRTIREKV
ncbi:MAG: hypothetical protein WC325_13265, partial [Candidatus Bathyarchaeia archaeon]